MGIGEGVGAGLFETVMGMWLLWVWSKFKDSVGLKLKKSKYVLKVLSKFGFWILTDW